MYCKNCGTNNPRNARVCNRCGTPLMQAQPVRANYGYGLEYHPEEHVSTGGWIGRSFLMVIPIVNIIMLFVWAFGSSKRRSLQTWARAQLVMVLIGIIIAIIVAVISLLTGGKLWEALKYAN